MPTWIGPRGTGRGPSKRIMQAMFTRHATAGTLAIVVQNHPELWQECLETLVKFEIAPACTCGNIGEHAKLMSGLLDGLRNFHADQMQALSKEIAKHE